MYINQSEGNDIPQRVSWEKRLGVKTYTVVVDIQEEIIDDERNKHYRWSEIHFDPGVLEYSMLVAAIIRSRFSADDVEAIVNNYLEDQTEEHTAEWIALQSWRHSAKETAKEILTEIEEME